MGNQRSSPAPSSLSYALPRLHQLCTPAPNENAAKVVVKFCYDFFLLPFAIRHSPFAIRRSSRSRTHFECVVCCRQRAGEGSGAPGGFACRWAWLAWGGGSFLSYFLLVFKVVKIDGPSAAVAAPEPPPAPAAAPVLLWPSLYLLLSCGLGLLKGISWIKLGRYIDRRSNGGYSLILKSTHGLETASSSIACWLSNDHVLKYYRNFHFS